MRTRATIPAVLALALCASAPRAAAQTAPLPAPFSGDATGIFTRADWLLSVAPMNSGDPRFSWSSRQRFDLDVARYPRGRVNLFFDNDIVMGSEHRSFDFNHVNTMFEGSASRVLPGQIEAAVVLHHVSRHLVDRLANDVVAWNTVAGRVERPFAIGTSRVTAALEVHRVVQHTFVDYRWFGQVTGRAEQPLSRGVRFFVTASGGLVGVDPSVLGDDGKALNRRRQGGARVEGGIHVPGTKAALDLFAAYERRVDGYPFGRVPLSWVEAGFRFASP